MGAGLRRVAVLGCSGAGKSTLAVELARRTDLPLVHLDEHFWQPGWVMPEDAAWREVHRRLVAEPAWVLDGNYATSYDERLPHADTVVVLEAGRLRCLVRVVRLRSHRDVEDFLARLEKRARGTLDNDRNDATACSGVGEIPNRR